MATFHSLEEAKEFFKGDRYAGMSGMQIDELSEDGCVCSMELNENHQNAYGGIMGGVTFTLGDFALAVTANQVHTLSVAQQVSINYLNAPKGSILWNGVSMLSAAAMASISAPSTKMVVFWFFIKNILSVLQDKDARR